VSAQGNILGFDYGLRRIGVAVGQTITRTAGTLETINCRDGVPDWKAVSRLIHEWQPAAVVVGIPYNMDDSEGELGKRARRFARQMEGRYGVPVHAIDERLTSVEAEATLRTQRQSGRRRIRREDVDSAAARVILQNWLNEN
jgi:putative Holliday junction resolvase